MKLAIDLTVTEEDTLIAALCCFIDEVLKTEATDRQVQRARSALLMLVDVQGERTVLANSRADRIGRWALAYGFRVKQCE